MAWESLKKRASQNIIKVLAETCQKRAHELNIETKQELDILWNERMYSEYIRSFGAAMAKVKASEAIDAAMDSIFTAGAVENGNQDASPQKHILDAEVVKKD